MFAEPNLLPAWDGRHNIILTIMKTKELLLVVTIITGIANVFAQNVQWKEHFGEPGTYRSVTTVSDGIIAVGNVGSIGFNGGIATIAKHDNNGNVVWKKSFGDLLADEFNSAIVVSDGIIAVGKSYLNAIGNTNTGDWKDISGSGSEAIIIKYTESNTGIIDVSKMSNFSIYPNPTSDSFIVDYDGFTQIEIYDMQGKKILTKNTSGKTEINISHLPKGVYNVRILSEDRLIKNSRITKQ